MSDEKNIYGDTTTSNSQATTNYEAAANDVLAVLDDFNFYTDTKFDPKSLKQRIVEAIRKNIEGNVNYARPTG